MTTEGMTRNGIAKVALMAGVILAATSGCSRKGGKNADFVTPSDKARPALEAALANWKNGQPSGSVPGKSEPAIQMLDAGWQASRKLVGYEILQEDSGSQGHRFFTVRLTFAEGPPVETRYVVMGIDPLLVTREEEFNKMSGTGQ
jgi:hypothetical protein